MNTFVRKYADSIIGSLSGFDRLILRGTLRAIAYVDGMRAFLHAASIPLTEFGRFAEITTQSLKEAAFAAAKKAGRPVQYLEQPNIRKDELARSIAERDRVDEGLICILTSLDPCWSYDIRKNREAKRLELVRRYRKCLHLYHYLIHPRFGFMHVRVQTWLPFNIRVWINGREWLARDLDRRNLGYCRRGNTFTWIEDVDTAQRLARAQLTLSWPKQLDAVRRLVHPVHTDLFGDYVPSYYWSVYQSEWATDVMFRDPESLRRIYPQLVHHGITQFGSRDVMRFLGKRLTADARIPRSFKAEVVTDLRERPEGLRLKHSLSWNSVKLYDKEGSNLRVETTINRPQDFKVFRPREGDEHGKKDWRPMRQGVADIHRRAQVSQAANDRYLDALAAVEVSTRLGEILAPLTMPAYWNGKRFRALNPARPDDVELLAAINRGEFVVRGFRNRDLRDLLFTPKDTDSRETKRRSAKVTRLIRILRAHGLIAKVQKTHRYLVTPRGRQVIAAVLAARDASVESLVREAA